MYLFNITFFVHRGSLRGALSGSRGRWLIGWAMAVDWLLPTDDSFKQDFLALWSYSRQQKKRSPSSYQKAGLRGLKHSAQSRETIRAG